MQHHQSDWDLPSDLSEMHKCLAASGAVLDKFVYDKREKNSPVLQVQLSEKLELTGIQSPVAKQSPADAYAASSSVFGLDTQREGENCSSCFVLDVTESTVLLITCCHSNSKYTSPLVMIPTGMRQQYSTRPGWLIHIDHESDLACIGVDIRHGETWMFPRLHLREQPTLPYEQIHVLSYDGHVCRDTDSISVCSTNDSNSDIERGIIKISTGVVTGFKSQHWTTNLSTTPSRTGGPVLDNQGLVVGLTLPGQLGASSSSSSGYSSAFSSTGSLFGNSASNGVADLCRSRSTSSSSSYSFSGNKVPLEFIAVDVIQDFLHHVRDVFPTRLAQHTKERARIQRKLTR